MSRKKTVEWHKELIKSLKDKDEAIAYLNVALEDEDPKMFLVALKNVMEAQGIQVQELSAITDLNRQNLYRMLSKNGNPRLTSIKSVLNGMGLNLNITESRR